MEGRYGLYTLSMHSDMRRSRFSDAPERFGGDRPRPQRPDREERPISQKPSNLDPVWHRDVGQPELQPGSETHRLFIAIGLPEPAIEEIGSFIDGMPTMAAGNVRWTRRENVHLTLLFLGDTLVELIPQIKERIVQAASNTSPFNLRLGQTGAFPSYHSPKILWVGLDGEVRKLVQLQGRLEGSLRPLGFEPERRKFTPHITVGRTVRDLTQQYAGDVGFSWRRSVLPDSRAVVPIDRVQLLRSHWNSDGAIYKPVFSATLGE